MVNPLSMYKDSGLNLGYTPQGFNNLGATPGVLPKPSNTTTMSGFNQGVQSNLLSINKPATPTGTVKKTTHTSANGDSLTTHYDTKPTTGNVQGASSTPGTNSGMIPSPTYQNNNKTAMYGSDGSLSGYRLADGGYESGGNNPQQGFINNQPNYGGVVGGLINASNQGSQGARDYTGQLATAGLANTGIGQRASDIANKYGEQIAQAGKLGANVAAGDLTGKGTFDVGGGNATIASNAASARMNALAQAEEAALKGTGQQLTAQQQMANALNQAAGNEYTGQGYLQSGLTAAGQLAQPQLAQPGQAFYNPITGQSSGGLSQETMQNYAQMAASGQYSSIPSSITSNPVLNDQLNQLAKQINPSYNPVSAGAQSTSLDSLTKQKVDTQTYSGAAADNLQLAISIAKQIPNLNTTAPIVNAIQQAIKSGATTAEQLPAFQSQINSVKDSYAKMGITPGIADWNLITKDQLDYLAQTLNKNVNNTISSIDDQIKKITGSGNSSSNNDPLGIR